MKDAVKTNRYEIILSGSGGQGIILGGIIFSTAVALYSDKNVVQTQSYGPEARGGASRTDIIISDGPIYYPKIISVDLLLSLTQESLDSYIRFLKDDGLLVLDPEYVSYKGLKRFKIIEIPFISIARDRLKKVLTANMLAVGAISGVLRLFPLDGLCEVMGEKINPALRDINERALRLGFKLGRRAWGLVR